MYNLFIISGPLQLLCALEAREHFNTTHNILLIQMKQNNRNNIQIDHLLELFPWEEVITLEHPSHLQKNIKTIKRLQHHTYEYLFFANFGALRQLLIANLKVKHLFQIDDGTMTLIIHKEDFQHTKHLKNKLFRRLRYNFFGLKTAVDITKISFFTMFDLSSRHQHQEIIKNDFLHLRKHYLKHLKADNEYLYVLGLSQGTVDEETYVSYIQQIINNCPDKKIIYFPHRNELITKERQELVTQNFIIFRPELPVELHFLLNNIYPMHIASFYSTALYTLKQFYSDATITAYVIPEEDHFVSQKTLQECYNTFKATAIDLVDLTSNNLKQ